MSGSDTGRQGLIERKKKNVLGLEFEIPDEL
jgi:hypothetical protein